MKFSGAEVTHAVWMLENQLNSPYELIALWMMFPQPSGPMIESTFPWFAGLESEMMI